MSVKLVAEGTEQVIEVRSAKTIVGRQTDCAVRIPAASVSRQHCALSFHDGYLTVEDLNSSNGTFINGKRVKKKRLIHPGDKLQIGPVTFRVEYAVSDTAVGAGKGPPASGDDVSAEVEELDVQEVETGEGAQGEDVEELEVEEVEELEEVEEGSESEPTTVYEPAQVKAARGSDDEDEEEDRPAPARSDADEPLKMDGSDLMVFLADEEDEAAPPPTESKPKHPPKHKGR